MKHSNIPRWAQWCAGISLLSVALAAAVISLTVNFKAGLIVHLAIGAMLALSDIGKILIPVVCQGIGWTIQSRITYAVVSVASVVCAFIFIEAMFDAQQAKVANQTVLTANADQRIADLRSSLKTTRTMAAEEAQRGGCGDKCQSLTAEASSLEAALTSAVTAREGMKTKSAVPSEGRALLLTLLGLAAMELLSHLAGSAASMIGMAMKSREEPLQPVKNVTKKPTVRKSRKVAQATPKQKAAKTFDQAFGAYKKGKIDGRTRAGRSIRKAANANVGKPANVDA